MRAGLPGEEARRTAQLRLGNALAIRERPAEAHTAPALDRIWRDVRHAVRQLGRSPGFTATAVVTLALGIGATTAIFTLVQQVMLRSLPVAQPDQLWRIGDQARCCYSAGYSKNATTTENDWSLFSWEAYQALPRRNSRLSRIWRHSRSVLVTLRLGVRRAGSPVRPRRAIGEYVSGNFFADAWHFRVAWPAVYRCR